MSSLATVDWSERSTPARSQSSRRRQVSRWVAGPHCGWDTCPPPLPRKLLPGARVAARAALAGCESALNSAYAASCRDGHGAGKQGVDSPIGREAFRGPDRFLSALAKTGRTSMMLLAATIVNDGSAWPWPQLMCPSRGSPNRSREKKIRQAIELSASACRDLDFAAPEWLFADSTRTRAKGQARH